MKNWKTTLVGCLAAGAKVALDLLSAGAVDINTVLFAAGMAALGFVAKDFNVTGK